MIIWTTCSGCGTRCTPVGFVGALGWMCADCYTYGTCHDCDTIMPKALLSDLGDGYQVCETCVMTTEARRMMALGAEEATV